MSTCSSSLKKEDSALYRTPATKREQWRIDIGNCFQRVRKNCSYQHPYTKVKKRWFEFEYQYLNRKGKVQILYNDCVGKGSLQCSQEHGNEDTVQRFSKLYENLETERSLQEIEANRLFKRLRIPFMDLTSEEVKRVFQTVKVIKHAYVKIRDNVFGKLGWLKDKSLDSMHGNGISASGTALVGLGGTIQLEAVIHNHKMALFCAPGVTLQSDVGVSADVGVFKTLGCKDNKDYQGKFLTFAAGVSGEAVGLPFNVGSNYALGMGVSEFLEALALAKREGRLDLTDLTKETIEFAAKAKGLMNDLNLPPDERFSYLITSKMIALTLGDKALLKDFNNDLKDLEEFVKSDGIDKTWRIKPLAHHIKSYLKFIGIVESASGLELSNFKLVVQELERSISSCDAVGLTGGVSLTLSPVNVGTIIFQYNMLTEIDLDDVMYLASFAPKTLMTLKLGAEERERFTKAVTGIIKIIPDLWGNRCAEEAFDKFSYDGIMLWDILTH